MNQSIGFAVVVLGVIMIFFAMTAPQSVNSDFSRFITGWPTNKTIGLLLGGAAIVIVGGQMSFHLGR